MRIIDWSSDVCSSDLTTIYGGNTSCVETRSGGDILVFDSGTGIRELGLSLMKEFQGKPLTVHLLIRHTHWDHIQGFQCFVPAYSANKIGRASCGERGCPYVKHMGVAGTVKEKK